MHSPVLYLKNNPYEIMKKVASVSCLGYNDFWLK